MVHRSQYLVPSLRGCTAVLAAIALSATAPVGAETRLAQASGPAGAATSPANPGDTAKAEAERVEKAIVRVQAAYQKFESLKADFTQNTKASGLSKPRVDSGTVELMKGGRMHWAFDKPEKRQFISDGQQLWIYTPNDKQVVITPLAEGASTTALNFMAGLGDIRRDFKVTLASGAAHLRADATGLHLEPHEQIGALKRLTIFVSDVDGLVREALVEDPMGAVVQMVFSKVKLNPKLDPARFTFKVPRGVTVIKPPAL